MSNLDKLKNRLESGKMLSSRNLLNSLHPSELARLIESLPLNERAIIWEMIDLKNEGDVLVEVADEVRDGLIDGMRDGWIVGCMGG